MVLFIEDGTGVANADSWVDATDCTAYITAHYDGAKLTAWTAASARHELLLRNAAQFMCTRYRGRWKGTRANEDQSLDWPRSDVEDSDGYCIDDDVVPQAIIDAQCELALRGVSAELLSDVSASSASIVSESKSVGSISKSVTYSGEKATQTSYPMVDNLLAPFLQDGARVVRA